MDFTVTKDYTTTKVKTDAKAEVMDVIISALVEKYGEDGVGMVRTGSSSKTNEIGVVIGSADVNGEKFPVCCTVNVSAKDFIERKTDKKIFAAFDFAAAREEYENYLVEKAEKEKKKKEDKEKKIEKDKAIKEKKEATENLTFDTDF